MGNKRYLTPREILGDRRRDRHLTAAEILSDELDGEETGTGPETATDGGRASDTDDESLGGEGVRERRATPGTEWQWLDDEDVQSRE